MDRLSQFIQLGCERLRRLPFPLQFLLFFAAVAVGHLTLLRLPYFWDEGGYYVPAALDFFHRGTLVPEYTNAHPPLPNIVLGSLWHVVGFHILPTRLTACAFAAAALLAVYRLSGKLLGDRAAAAVAALTAVYPIWFAQSSLVHADIFAAAFTLWALNLYLKAQGLPPETCPRLRNLVRVAVLFSLAALSKETAIVTPVALAAFHLPIFFKGNLFKAWLAKGTAASVREVELRWASALGFPVLPLLAWFGYHRLRTGFIFGNPEYLRYNATANLSVSHVLTALRYRLMHLAWQRNIWLPILIAIACLLLGRRPGFPSLPGRVKAACVVVLLTTWLAFSVLGGALLTRYLLPEYPLILLLCVAVWRERTRWWPAFTLLTATVFVLGWWWSAPAAYAPEDNLTYRDMIVVHQDAVAYIDAHFPKAHVLTAWPASAELFRPELGYTDRQVKVTPLENFTAEEIGKAETKPESYDTALIFTTHFVPPSLGRYLMKHPETKRGREYIRTRDLSPQEVASRLGGQVVFFRERSGEWAAVLRFPRSYQAELHPSSSVLR